MFGMSASSEFLAPSTDLPSHLRYFDGHPPDTLTFGSAWPTGEFQWIGDSTEILPGIHLIAMHGDWGVDLAVKELSLAIETDEGIVLIVGCSHPRLATIVEATIEQTGERIAAVVGGFHLLPASDQDVADLALRLSNDWNIAHIAPAHCTGERAVAVLRDRLGDRFLESGVGSVLEF